MAEEQASESRYRVPHIDLSRYYKVIHDPEGMYSGYIQIDTFRKTLRKRYFALGMKVELPDGGTAEVKLSHRKRSHMLVRPNGEVV